MSRMILCAVEFRICLCLQSRQTHKRFWIKQNQTKLSTYFSFHLCEDKLLNGFIITTSQTKVKRFFPKLPKIEWEPYFVGQLLANSMGGCHQPIMRPSAAFPLFCSEIGFASGGEFTIGATDWRLTRLQLAVKLGST